MDQINCTFPHLTACQSISLYLWIDLNWIFKEYEGHFGEKKVRIYPFFGTDIAQYCPKTLLYDAFVFYTEQNNSV